MALQDALDELENFDFDSDDCMGKFYEIAEQLEAVDLAGESIEAILRFMEANPDEEFGSPGPLVHFVESFLGKGYEVKLVESLKRCASPHVVWMLNRLINGSVPEKAAEYLDLMRELAGSPDAEIAAEATFFLEVSPLPVDEDDSPRSLGS